MLNKVRETIEKYNMTDKSERVLVGLSGGADSVSLLFCLKHLGYDVRACHINHQLRGDESLRDEQFCIDLCKSHEIPIDVHRIDVKGYCAENGCSVEEGARKLRYSIFDSSGCDKIATAHTLSDCFETTIFNLARGTGLKGLCSIPPIRGKIIRPLIECTRQEVEGFLTSQELSYVTDSTNLQTDYSRNKIRHLIIPTMTELNSSLMKTYKNTLDNLKDDEEYLEIQTDELISHAKSNRGYSAQILTEAHTAARNRAINRILSDNGISYSHQRAQEISNIIKHGGKVNIHKSTYAVCKNGYFNIETIDNDICTPPFYQTIDFSNEYDFFGKNVKFRIAENGSGILNVNKMFANTCCDYDKIIGDTVMRNRIEGDKITLCNRDFQSSVKKLFNAKIPRDMRDKTVILQDENGIFFIEGFGCADRVKIDKSTKRILICEIS